jgi:ABC-type sulfate transport system substrate-binding protein
MIQRQRFLKTLLVAALLSVGGITAAQTSPVTLLNVSYDPTRELYTESMLLLPNTGKHKRAKT